MIQLNTATVLTTVSLFSYFSLHRRYFVSHFVMIFVSHFKDSPRVLLSLPASLQKEYYIVCSYQRRESCKLPFLRRLCRPFLSSCILLVYTYRLCIPFSYSSSFFPFFFLSVVGLSFLFSRFESKWLCCVFMYVWHVSTWRSTCTCSLTSPPHFMLKIDDKEQWILTVYFCEYLVWNYWKKLLEEVVLHQSPFILDLIYFAHPLSSSILLLHCLYPWDFLHVLWFLGGSCVLLL